MLREPLYCVDEDGSVNDEKPSFFQEYNWKLKKGYNDLLEGSDICVV